MFRAPVVLRGRPSGAVLARTRLDTVTHLGVVVVVVTLLVRIIGLFLLGGSLRDGLREIASRGAPADGITRVAARRRTETGTPRCTFLPFFEA